MKGRVLTSVVASFFLLTGAVSAYQGSWILPAKALPGGATRGFPTPQVAVGPGQTATAVWVDRANNGNADTSDDRWRIRASTRPTSGKFGRPVNLLSVPTRNEEISASTVAAGTAGTVVSWIQVDKRQRERAVHFRFRPKGGKFGPVRSIASGGNPSGLFSARGPDGTMALAWASDVGVRVAIRYPRTGVWATFDFSVPIFGVLTDLAVAPDRDVMVTWEQPTFSSDEAAVGVIRGGTRRLPVKTFPRARTPRAAFAPDGSAVIVWRQGDAIFFATRGTGGGYNSPSRVTPRDKNKNPDVAIGGNGRISIVYQTQRRRNLGSGSAYSTYSEMTVATRPKRGRFEYRKLGGRPKASASDPRIVASANGTTTVLWSEDVYAGRNEIRTVTRYPNGRFSRPTTLGNGSADTVSLATGPDGTAVAVWSVRNEKRQFRLRTASTRP